MAPTVQLIQESSSAETIYAVDSEATESAKLLKISLGYKSATLRSFRAIYNVNIYGYINAEIQGNSEKERSERAAMQARFNNVRSSLIRMGVPNERIWVGGVAFSSTSGGQIHVSVKEIVVDSIILPPYTPAVPSQDPQKPSGAKEQWIDADGSVKKDVLEGTIAIEIEVSLKEGGIFRTKPPISVKASVKSDGTVELGAELTAIEQEIKKKAVWGLIQEVKFKVSVEANAGFKFDERRITSEVNAAVKAALSATLVIPGTSIKIPVELSIGVDVEGKVVPGLQTTYRW